MPQSDRVDLESKLAFLEHTLDELSEVVLEQGRTLEAMGRTITRLEARLRDGSGGDGPDGDPLEERPPHY